jgi:alpha-tubulin suppressor-like RCC1 family protein
MKRLTPTRALVAAAATIGLVALPAGVSPASAASGDVLTFGANTFGQLGTGVAVGSTPRPTPAKVLGSATDVAGGREHVLALVGGHVWAWGADGKGAVGDGGGYATAVTKPEELGLTGVDSVATGHYHSMALDKDSDTVWAWGWNSRGQIGPAGGTAGKVAAPKKVTLPSGNVTMIAAGRAHSLALVGGNVYAWGDNNSGQLGQSADTARHPTPTKVAGLPAGSVTWVAGGRDSSFAIAGGNLYAWGNNQYGQLGIGSTTSKATPQLVTGGIKQVESGADHTVALTTGGAVKAWGRNEYGQVGVSGSGNKTSPVTVPGLSNVIDVRVGRDHSMAIDGNHHLWTWGRNDGGQLGASGVSQRTTPGEVTSAGTVKDAGGGQVYTVVLQGT